MKQECHVRKHLQYLLASVSIRVNTTKEYVLYFFSHDFSSILKMAIYKIVLASTHQAKHLSKKFWPNRWMARDVTTGVTSKTVVTPRFLDILTLFQLMGAGSNPPSQRSHQKFSCGYISDGYCHKLVLKNIEFILVINAYCLAYRLKKFKFIYLHLKFFC